MGVPGREHERRPDPQHASRASGSATRRSRPCGAPTASGSARSPVLRPGRPRAAYVRQLAENAKVDVGEVSFTSIGPTWGEEITAQGLPRPRDLLLRCSPCTSRSGSSGAWRSPPSPPWCTTCSSASACTRCFGFEVTPATVIAFLTIFGFSLYDTIVVFDKVHENTRRVLATGRATYGDVVNLSMNQVLARSLNTTLCAVLPVLSLLFVGSIVMGATALRGLRARAARRPHHGLVLVDLHRHADPGRPQGARASVRGAQGQVRQHDGCCRRSRPRWPSPPSVGGRRRCRTASTATAATAPAPPADRASGGSPTGGGARSSTAAPQEEAALNLARRTSR